MCFHLHFDALLFYMVQKYFLEADVATDDDEQNEDLTDDGDVEKRSGSSIENEQVLMPCFLLYLIPSNLFNFISFLLDGKKEK